MYAVLDLSSHLLKLLSTLRNQNEKIPIGPSCSGCEWPAFSHLVQAFVEGSKRRTNFSEQQSYLFT